MTIFPVPPSNGTLLNIDIETLILRQKTEIQKDDKTKDDEYDSDAIQTTSNDLLRSIKGRWRGGGAMSSRIVYLSIELNDLKRSVNLRWKFDPVQHSSLNYFFSSCWGSSKLPPSQETNVYTDWSILCSLAHFQGWDTVDKKYTA